MRGGSYQDCLRQAATSVDNEICRVFEFLDSRFCLVLFGFRKRCQLLKAWYMSTLVADVKDIGWRFKMDVHDAERIRLADCPYLVKNPDSIDNYSCFGAAGAEVSD